MNHFFLRLFTFKGLLGLLFFGIGLIPHFLSIESSYSFEYPTHRLKLGSQVTKKSYWMGNQVVPSSLPILLLAGHADSQGIEGAGTAGEAVDLKGSRPMDLAISDELFWNLKVCKALERLGRKAGLNISFYDPGQRTISDGNHKVTNWTVGAKHAQKGGYPLEIHFDSYGSYGFGSGLIPPLSTQINNIDESLARTFGRYPLFFRGGLGGPRRQIRILEIGKLEGPLENDLRNAHTQEQTIEAIANRILQAIVVGLNKKDLFNPGLQEGDIFLLNSYL